MTVRAKRVTIGVVLALLVVPVAVWFFFLRPPADLRAFGALSREWQAAGPDAGAGLRSRLAERCLELSREFPGTVGGSAALLLAATKAPGTSAGRDATTRFARLIDEADLGLLASVFHRSSGSLSAVPQFAAPLLARVRASPDHPACGRLLAACSLMTLPRDGGEPPTLHREVADLIADRHADSPDLCRFCEGLAGTAGGPPWAIRYERHLRAILAANRDRAVRCAAQFALASAVLAAGEERQADAEALFEQFCSEFDGKHSYRYQNIEQNYLHEARTQLNELRFRAVGKAAPDLDGIDLDDRPLKLSDYRGRAVLLNFWGTWCFPCMKLVPHERALAAAYQGRPFDVVGVNCDDDVEKARAAATRTGMSWRSFRDRSGDRAAITRDWKVLGYPTLYLIDHHGTVRKRWVGAPPPDELGRGVRVLVEAAEKKVPADAMRPVAAALDAALSAAPTAPPPGKPTAPRPGTGLVEKVYRGPDGAEAKYAVFVPPGYDGPSTVPAILYLHGAGPRGTDGRAHLETGLARVVRGARPDFPFLVIFPQAREGEDWSPDNPGGRRALAILAQCQKDYRINPHRVALTGTSMGGAGTWALAAADPKRWSAIVPICHGGDTAAAAKLVGVPCWCFHGAADRVIPPHQSREMVDAILKAGGRPLYQELPGVGHNDCAERVYALSDLTEWLLLQDRSRR